MGWFLVLYPTPYGWDGLNEERLLCCTGYGSMWKMKTIYDSISNKDLTLITKENIKIIPPP